VGRRFAQVGKVAWILKWTEGRVGPFAGGFDPKWSGWLDFMYAIF
jgi:hypothetical protein